jgi:hypothetical protein
LIRVKVAVLLLSWILWCGSKAEVEATVDREGETRVAWGEMKSDMVLPLDREMMAEGTLIEDALDDEAEIGLTAIDSTAVMTGFDSDGSESSRDGGGDVVGINTVERRLRGAGETKLGSDSAEAVVAFDWLLTRFRVIVSSLK